MRNSDSLSFGPLATSIRRPDPFRRGQRGECRDIPCHVGLAGVLRTVVVSTKVDRPWRSSCSVTCSGQETRAAIYAAGAGSIMGPSRRRRAAAASIGDAALASGRQGAAGGIMRFMRSFPGREAHTEPGWPRARRRRVHRLLRSCGLPPRRPGRAVVTLTRRTRTSDIRRDRALPPSRRCTWTGAQW